jgi:pSer/pThr/pTyr-binding forkhead associated (FHA) protein
MGGSRLGQRFPLLCSNITLGSSPGCDIRLSDPGIKNFHAQIHFKGRKHYLENLDSMGCSFVNGTQGSQMELKDGDIIRLADVKFQVEYSDLN